MANTSFAQLKKNRKSNFEKLNEELKKASTSKVEFKKDDDRIWYPDVDKVGNGYAVIRFLPASEGEDVPFVRRFRHAFQGPSGSWYIENSLTTLGLPDPVSDYNSKLWNSGEEYKKEIARKQKRKLEYFSNVYVIKDGAKPENEGKVFLFRYGKKIFDKLFEANNPKFEDEKPLDPFDLWEGANFKLKIKQVEGYRNYDSSSFDAPAKLFADDGKLERVWKQAHPLKPFIDPKEFKSYDELKSKFERVVGLHDNDKELDEAGFTLPKTDMGPRVKAKPPKREPEIEPVTEGDDDDLNFFRTLAESKEEDLIA